MFPHVCWRFWVKALFYIKNYESKVVLKMQSHVFSPAILIQMESRGSSSGNCNQAVMSSLPQLGDESVPISSPLLYEDE